MFGSIQTDVIVNSAHHSLDLTIGATSKSLLRAGGDDLQSEVKVKYPRGITPGKVAITKGGRLQCSQVYHGTLQKYEGDKKQALQVRTMESLKSKSLFLIDLKSVNLCAV